MTDAARLLACLATRQVAERYGMAVDRGDGALFAGQFTPDGVLESPRGTFAGREALSGIPAMMKGLYRATWHGVLGQVVEFAGDHGEGETYCIARHFYDEDGPRCLEMTIRYYDGFRCHDGVWLLRTRRLIVEARSRYPVDTQ